MKKIKMQYFVHDIIMGNIENVKLVLKDKRIDFERIIPYLKFAIIQSATDNQTEIVKLLLTDKRLNPKGEDGIRLTTFATQSIDIVVFDDVVCRVVNENALSIQNDVLREKYLKWLYRIGGEKHSKARNTVEK
jgi:hypothetical protein